MLLGGALASRLLADGVGQGLGRVTPSAQALAVARVVAPTVGYLDDVVRFGGALSASVGVVLAAVASALRVTLQDEPAHRGREALAVAASPLSAGHGSYWEPQRPRLLANSQALRSSTWR